MAAGIQLSFSMVLSERCLMLRVAAVITHVDWSAVSILAALLLPWPWPMDCCIPALALVGHMNQKHICIS